MIRFCDKEVWTIQDGQWTRLQMLNFFIKGHVTDIVQVVDKKNRHIGVVTYKKLLKTHDCIPLCNKIFIINDDFWKEATEYFDDNVEDIVPVMDHNYNIIGFCYNDTRLYINFQMALHALEEGEIPVPLHQLYPRIRQVCIMDINEVSFRLYKILQKQDISVCVIGEKWEWFGIPSYLGYSDYPDYSKLFIYSEGTSMVRAENEFTSSGSEELGGNLWVILEQWTLANTRFVVDTQIRRLIDKGANVCKVIFPEFSDLSYLTDIEAKSITYQCTLEKYVNGEVISEEAKQIYWDIWGKENCEYFKEKHAIKEASETLLNGVMSHSYGSVLGKPKIYLIGVCVVAGYALRRQQTMPALLQRLVSDRYNVITLIANTIYFHNWMKCFEKIHINSRDLVLVINSRTGFIQNSGEMEINLLEEFNRPDRATYFSLIPLHVNVRGAEMTAQVIFEKFIKQHIELSKEQKYSTRPNYCIQLGEALTDKSKTVLFDYLHRISRFDLNNINPNIRVGVIMMNCNPFTLGHQYLIEYAASKVDYLYIFVVEEDRSLFSFRDRYEMVIRGTTHLSNVIVNPSGDYMISYKTLPLYFYKEEIQDKKVDMTADIEVFARYIAPELGVTVRFVGEEPLDRVTRQYNEQMKILLQDYGIELCEIPRKEQDGRVISASLVRKYLKEGNWTEARKLIPEVNQEICQRYLYA